MSWINFNESLSSIKGQITNFASNVLTEQDQEDDSEELVRICQRQQEEINGLRKLNEELSKAHQKPGQNNEHGDQSLDQWSWDSPRSTENSDETAALKAQLTVLQSEKNELLKNLELLDTEYQQNTEKLVSIKEKLQADYHELEDKHIAACDKNKILETELKEKKIKLEKALRSQASVPQNIEIGCTKCADLAVLQTTCADLKEKLKLAESENKILVKEMKSATGLMNDFKLKSEEDAEHFKKLSRILEGYEQQVTSLKQEIAAKSKPETGEVSSNPLDEEKDKMHNRYISILTENVKKYAGCKDSAEFPTNPNENEDPRISEFSHQVENIMKILLDLRYKCDKLEADLYNITQEKTDILTEKNHEIEKLIQNSEILSQEVITKSQTVKEFELEIHDLMKNNDDLIIELQQYKNSGLQTISESNEDNLLLLESQLENANKRIEELESQIQDTTDGQNVEEALIQKDELQSELEKLKSDLEINEYQFSENKIHLDSLKEETDQQKQNIKDLALQKISLEKMNGEYERLIADLRGDVNDLREKFLMEEDFRKQFEGQVRHLTEKLQHSKMCETSLKLQCDTVNKELAAALEAKNHLDASLKNSLADLKQYQTELNNLRNENDKLKQRVEDLQQEIDTTKMEMSSVSNTTLETVNLNEEETEDPTISIIEDLRKEKEILEARISQLVSIEEAHRQCISKIDTMERSLAESNKAKEELTGVVLTKHQDSVTYYNEIQRLTQILNAEMEKTRELESRLKTNPELQRKTEELEKLTDQNQFLREKCDVLTANLLQEQSKCEKITAEQGKPSEKELTLSKNLERLQRHLMEVEEHYTQELLRAEENKAELLAKMTELEHREKNSSTMYTSVSIRANQHVETLQHQLQLITSQRDELRKKMSEMEDQASRQDAALANLQFVLEQFQKDRNQDVQQETERIRRQIGVEKKIQENLISEMESLKSQLSESKQGLLAASRLSDQLELSKEMVVTLKNEVSQLQERLVKTEKQLQEANSQTDGKVDKSLLKNLVIGFVTSNNNLTKDQTQILKIIATVLDFNQNDHDKLNLSKPHQGWLGSLLTPQAGTQGVSQESLAHAFVKFLENESNPRVVPSLLQQSDPQSRKTSFTQAPTGTAPTTSMVLSEVVLPTFADFAQNRNSSSILKDVLKDSSQ